LNKETTVGAIRSHDHTKSTVICLSYESPLGLVPPGVINIIIGLLPIDVLVHLLKFEDNVPELPGMQSQIQNLALRDATWRNLHPLEISYLDRVARPGNRSTTAI
jgi:hypothetical protein